MNVTYMRAANYRSYDHVELDFPHGCVAVVGPNGSGKSSLIETIPLALYGPPPGFRSLADFHKDDATEPLLIEIGVEHAGESYRIRRTFNPRGRGSTGLDFEATDGALGDWRPLTRETVKETEKAIVARLGLTERTFCASAYLRQSDSGAFTEADPKERKEILAEVLALDVWQRLLAHAAADHKAAEAALQVVLGEASTYEATIADKPRVDALLAACADVERNAAADLVSAGLALEAAEAGLREAEQHASNRRAAEAELARAQAEHGRLSAIRAAANQAAEDRAVAIDEVLALTTADQLARLVASASAAEIRVAEARDARATYDAAVREYDLKKSQRDAITAQAGEHRARAANLRDQANELEARGPGNSVCSHCQQTLGAEALVSALASMRVEADEHDAAAKDLDAQAAAVEWPFVPPAPAGDVSAVEEELAHARRAVLKAQEDQAARARLEERIRTLDATIAEAAKPGFAQSLSEAAATLSTAAADLAALGEIADIPGKTAAVASARREVEQERQRLQTALAEQAKAETLQAQIADAETKLAASRARSNELHAEVDLLADLEKAYGRDGVPALIVESQAVPHIETEANRILADLGTPYRVELHTQRALKSGDGLRDTLDVIVVGDAGARPYETFSGGERTRINLALRIALARLLANRRGAESRLLVIDEPDGLDQDGFARLVDVLRGLEDTFSSIFVVSHHPDLRDAFDERLEVVKDEAGSRIVTGVLAEPVAA